VKVVSIVLKPLLEEGEFVTIGHIIVDENPVLGTLLKIELEVLPLSGPAVLRSKNCYTFRCELKGSQMTPISEFNDANAPRFKIPVEDLHRFSGFLEGFEKENEL